MCIRDRTAAAEVVRARFAAAFAGFPADRPCWILGHNDADGLSATAVVARAMARAARPAETRIVGRGENAWSTDMRAEIAGHGPGGVIVCDLGVGSGPVAPGAPTIVIDHHVPRGAGDGTVISGLDFDPAPTTSLLAYWCAGAVAEVDDLLWLCLLYTSPSPRD